MNKLLIAPQREYVSGPSVFLVGPITDAPDWQTEAAKILLPHFSIFNPRRPDMLQPGQDPDNVDFFNEQTDWELDHLELAYFILIWMANSIDPASTRMIGRASRVEVGFNIGRRKKVFVGIEPGFPGERYLCKFCARFGYKVYSSLGEDCQAIINHLIIHF